MHGPCRMDSVLSGGTMLDSKDLFTFQDLMHDSGTMLSQHIVATQKDYRLCS